MRYVRGLILLMLFCLTVVAGVQSIFPSPTRIYEVEVNLGKLNLLFQVLEYRCGVQWGQQESGSWSIETKMAHKEISYTIPDVLPEGQAAAIREIHLFPMAKRFLGFRYFGWASWGELAMPVWHWLLLTTPPLLWFGYRRFRQSLRRAPGLCPNCGYDLRAHKPENKCPECGMPVKGIELKGK